MMYKLDAFQLITGRDIFIPEIQAKIHQPSIREISELGEEGFFESANLFFINSESVKEKIKESAENDLFDKNYIDLLNDYSILILFLNSDKELRIKFSNIIKLIFPDYTIFIENGEIIFEKEEKKSVVFSEENYRLLKDLIYQIFCFDKLAGSSILNAQSALAKKIAEKMRKAKEKKAQLESEEGKEHKSVFSHYISILSVGIPGLNISTIQDLTIYQLYNQYERYTLKLQHETSFSAALAGSKGEIADWLKEI